MKKTRPNSSRAKAPHVSGVFRGSRNLWQSFLDRAPFWVVGGVLMVSFLAMKKIMEPQVLNSAEVGESYEMPRVKSDFGIQIFSKNIIRKYFGFNDGSRVASAEPALAQNAVNPAHPAKVAKVAKSQAKKEDPKKKKDDKKTAKNSNNIKIKATVSVNVQEGADRYSQKLSETDSDVKSEGPVAYIPAESVSVVTPSPMIEEEDKLSAQQWRALIFSQPTSANQSKFLAAYRAKDIDESSFYQIVHELLIDTAADRQKAGLELYKATPSVKTYTALLAQYQQTTTESLRAQVGEVLKSYSDVSKFSVLNQLLYSSDARVVSSAETLLSQAIAKFQAQQSASNLGRDTRSPGSTTTVQSAAVLKNFLPGLKRLMTSNNSTISQQAQSIVESINALNTLNTASH